jgi:sigma-B regulation protein RsbU (phosphoserine phosphatase)
MPAALLMAISLVAFQNSAAHSHSPQTLFKKLDDTLQPYTRSTNQNCALVYSHLQADPTPGTWHLTIGNAGCITPLIRRADGSVSWLDARGMPLGITDLEILAHQPVSLTAHQGDTLILTSDGVVEAHNPHQELFGFDRLYNTLLTAPSNTAAALISHLKQNLKTFTHTAPEQDDITIMAVHFQ